MTRIFLLAAAVAASTTLFAADAPLSGIAKVYDGEVRQVESEIGSLAEAMPAELYNFAPTQGEFKGVRTFSQQMSHIATVIYEVSAAALGEKCPVEAGQNENGAASIQGKAAVVKYLKDSFAYAHKAAGAHRRQHDGHDAVALRQSENAARLADFRHRLAQLRPLRPGRRVRAHEQNRAAR